MSDTMVAIWIVIGGLMLVAWTGFWYSFGKVRGIEKCIAIHDSIYGGPDAK